MQEAAYEAEGLALQFYLSGLASALRTKKTGERGANKNIATFLQRHYVYPPKKNN